MKLLFRKKLEYANRIKILFSYIIVTRLKALVQERVLFSLLTLIKQIKEFYTLSLSPLRWDISHADSTADSPTGSGLKPGHFLFE